MSGVDGFLWHQMSQARSNAQAAQQNMYRLGSSYSLNFEAPPKLTPAEKRLRADKQQTTDDDFMKRMYK